MAVTCISNGLASPRRAKVGRYSINLTMRREAFTRMTPVGRLAEPDDIAGVIAFLASEDSGYITGATIDVNGGRLMLI